MYLLLIETISFLCLLQNYNTPGNYVLINLFYLRGVFKCLHHIIPWSDLSIPGMWSFVQSVEATDSFPGVLRSSSVLSSAALTVTSAPGPFPTLQEAAGPPVLSSRNFFEQSGQSLRVGATRSFRNCQNLLVKKGLQYFT